MSPVNYHKQTLQVRYYETRMKTECCTEKDHSERDKLSTLNDSLSNGKNTYN